MFGFFKKTASEAKKLEKKYQSLMDESYRLSHSDRKASDDKRSEAEALLKQIEELEKSKSQ